MSEPKEHVFEDSGYITHGWMIKTLGLSGNELAVYAIIFSFSKDGEGYFYGSLSYLEKWLSVSRPTAIKTLQSLVAKGLIKKYSEERNGMIFNRYRAALRGSKEFLLAVKSREIGVVKSEEGGSKIPLPNKELIINNSKKENSDFEKKSQTEMAEVVEVFEEKKQPEISILNGRQSKKKVAPKKKEPDLFGDYGGDTMKAELWPSFEDFWALYDKKTGKEKSLQKWAKLKQSDKEKIMQHVPDYVASQPDKTYRKNPETYLNGKCWNDEIIVKGGKKDNISYFYTEEGFNELLDSALK